jgi:hypothetical protein
MTQTAHEKAAQERKERLEKYFRRVPDPGQRTTALTLLSVAAAAGVLGLILFAAESGFLGFLLLAGGIWAGVKGYGRKAEYDRRLAASTPRPDDAEMDRILAADLTDIVRRSLDRLGLTGDELEFVDRSWDPIANLLRGGPARSGGKQPMVVFGPLDSARVTVGADDVWRFSAYEVMVICPTGYHLAIYRCALDFLTGGLRGDETQEYHYNDVVAVSTTARPGDAITAAGAGAHDDEVRFARTVRRQFQVVVSSSDRSTITVGIADEADPERQAKLQDSGIDQVITSVRRMLKEKKGGVVAPPAAPGRY